MTTPITEFSTKGKEYWDSLTGVQKDTFISRETVRMSCGFLTKFERDMLNFLVKVREEEKKADAAKILDEAKWYLPKGAKIRWRTKEQIKAFVKKHFPVLFWLTERMEKSVPGHIQA